MSALRSSRVEEGGFGAPGRRCGLCRERERTHYSPAGATRKRHSVAIRLAASKESAFSPLAKINYAMIIADSDLPGGDFVSNEDEIRTIPTGIWHE
jgi:hypothetical protein